MRVTPANRDYIRDQTQDTHEHTHLWTPPRTHTHTAAHTSGKSASLKLPMLFTVLRSQRQLWPVLLAVSLSPQLLMNWHNSKITSASPSYSEVGWSAGGVTWKSATCWTRTLQPVHRVWHPLQSLCCWFWRVKIQLVWNLILPVHWLCLNRLNWLCKRGKVRSRWEESISTQQLMCHF